MILVDTCVLLDLMTDDPRWRDWSRSALIEAARVDELAVNPVIYGEVAVGLDETTELDAGLKNFRFLPLSREVAWRAAKAQSRYLGHGGKQRRILGDFWIGAHAEVERLGLLTRNPRAYREFEIPHLVHP